MFLDIIATEMSQGVSKDISLDDAVPLKLWWLTGGKGHPPSWQGYLRMTRERSEQREAQIAWKEAKRQAQDAFKQQWGGGGRARGLRRWHKTHRDSQSVIHDDAKDQVQGSQEESNNGGEDSNIT